MIHLPGRQVNQGLPDGLGGPHCHVIRDPTAFRHAGEEVICFMALDVTVYNMYWVREKVFHDPWVPEIRHS